MHSASAYLDHNATTPMRPEALAALVEAARAGGNPSSVHGHGRNARRIVDEARASVAEAVGARPSDIVFTGGGTEANQLALRGLRAAGILASAIEHDSALPAGAVRVPVTADGVVDLEALDRLLAAAPKPALVVLMLANNETGVIQPVAEAVRIVRAHGALIHCDAVQALGKIPFGLLDLGVDTLAVSAHKIGGPQGVGALALRPDLAIAPLLTGGGQESGRRAGTENVPGIAGFAAAARAMGGLQPLAALRDDMERRLKAVAPSLRVWGDASGRLPNTSCFGVSGLKSETQVIALDLAGVAVSAGSACSSGKVRQSHVLAAMGADAASAGSAIRVSLGWTTQATDVERLVGAWSEFYLRRAGQASAAAAA